MNRSLPPILLVDDEKNMRLSLETVLKAEGYAVRLADSAEAASAARERPSTRLVAST